MNKESMIKVLRYKAEHIKTKIKPEFFNEVADMLDQQPCDQIKWERDMAIAQLKELGYGLGEKPKTGHWIPVDKRLPEEGKLILLCFRSAKDTPHWRIQVGCLGRHDVEDCFLEKIGAVPVWYTDKFYWSFDKVVAWMSLPESYKAEREGKNE